MSVRQARNFRDLKALLEQLRSFGLNPRDWRFERSSLQRMDRIELRHRMDQELRVQGRVRHTPNGRPDWAQLAFASW